MTLPDQVRRALIASAAGVLFCASPCRAQSPAGLTAATRDSLLDCASRLAGTAGFSAAPGASAGRLGLMRSRTTPAGTLLDGLRVSLASKDSASTGSLDVRVTTFLTSRTDPFSHQEMAPPRALAALADSIRLLCQPRR
jgi:hypothetical protein